MIENKHSNKILIWRKQFRTKNRFYRQCWDSAKVVLSLQAYFPLTIKEIASSGILPDAQPMCLQNLFFKHNTDVMPRQIHRRESMQFYFHQNFYLICISRLWLTSTVSKHQLRENKTCVWQAEITNGIMDMYIIFFKVAW